MSTPNQDKILEILFQIRIKMLSHEYGEVSRLCKSLEEFTEELSKLQLEKITWYKFKAKEQQ